MMTQIPFLLDYDGYFMINEEGELFVQGNLDCCDVVYRIKVRAKDQGIPPLNSAEVEIVIVPFSSNKPPQKEKGEGRND